MRPIDEQTILITGATDGLGKGVATELEGVTGRYFRMTQEEQADAQAYDPDARRRLRQVAQELTGVRTAAAGERRRVA